MQCNNEAEHRSTAEACQTEEKKQLHNIRNRFDFKEIKQLYRTYKQYRTMRCINQQLQTVFGLLLIKMIPWYISRKSLKFTINNFDYGNRNIVRHFFSTKVDFICYI